MVQVRVCTTRQFQIIWGDRKSVSIKLTSALIRSLVTSSLFYNLTDTSNSIFLRPRGLFFPIVFSACSQYSNNSIILWAAQFLRDREILILSSSCFLPYEYHYGYPNLSGAGHRIYHCVLLDACLPS